MIWEEGQIPTPSEFIDLRVSCGLSGRTEAAAAKGLPNGLHVVTLRDAGRLIAMGRVIGDGGTAVQIVDICVSSDYRRQGLASEVMRRLMRWCDTHLPQSCYISLIADPGAEKVYERFGFAPTEGMGMSHRPQRDRDA